MKLFIKRAREPTEKKRVLQRTSAIMFMITLNVISKKLNCQFLTLIRLSEGLKHFINGLNLIKLKSWLVREEYSRKNSIMLELVTLSLKLMECQELAI